MTETARSFGTHDGSFHADEITACALLLLFGLIDRTRIFRTREMEQLARCEYVCDVGGVYDPLTKRFDHHQAEYRGALSSAGMVWQYLREQKVTDEATYQWLNRSLILGVDAHDNGVVCAREGTTTFSNVVSNFAPVSHNASETERLDAFFDALDFVLGHLKRLVERGRYVRACRDKVQQAMAHRGVVLLFDEAIPWIESFFELGGESHPAQFVVMPAGSHWKLRGIPPKRKQLMKVRTPLPKAWAGLAGEELQRVTGIAGAVFCHKARFISVWQTQQDALSAVQHMGV